MATRVQDKANLELKIEELENVNSAVDPASDFKHLRWDSATSKWLDGYAKIYSNDAVDGSVCNPGVLQFEKTNDKMVICKPTSQFRFMNLNVPRSSPGDYATIDTKYTPTIRFKPADLGGTVGALTWASTPPGGSITGQGSATNIVSAGVGGKDAVNVNPVSTADMTKRFDLDLGVTYTNISWTLAVVLQDVAGFVGGSRMISFKDANPDDLNDDSNVNEMLVMFGLSQMNSLKAGVGTIAWGTSTLTSDINLAPQPAVMVFRYNTTTNEYKVWLNKETDSIRHTSTGANLDTLSLRNIRFGYRLPADAFAAQLKVAEVIFWNSAISDINVTDLSQDLLLEYGVRTGTNLLYNRIVAPVSTDDSGEGHSLGSKWHDTTGVAEYVCLDPTTDNAVWKETTKENLSEQNDVVFTSVVAGNQIIHNGTNWINNIVSIGGIYVEGNAVETPIAITSTPVRIGANSESATTAYPDILEFDNGGSNDYQLRYTGTVTKQFQIHVTLSSFKASAGVSVTFEYYLAKNGTKITGTSVLRQGSSQDYGSITTNTIVGLATNDVISVWVQNNTNTENVTVENLSLTAK